MWFIKGEYKIEMRDDSDDTSTQKTFFQFSLQSNETLQKWGDAICLSLQNLGAIDLPAVWSLGIIRTRTPYQKIKYL